MEPLEILIYGGTKLVSLVGVGLTISTITRTTQNIYDVATYIGGISKSASDDIKRKIDELDLINTLRLIDSFINTIDQSKVNQIITNCLNSLHHTINLIASEMKILRYEIKYNSSLYFGYSWRAYDCMPRVKKLESMKKILNERLDILVKLIPVSNVEFLKNNQKNSDDLSVRPIAYYEMEPEEQIFKSYVENSEKNAEFEKQNENYINKFDFNEAYVLIK